MIPLLSTGAATRDPEFPDPRRILEHPVPFARELSIYRSWDEGVVETLTGLDVATAHADKSIGATLSGDEPALGRFERDCRIAAALGDRIAHVHVKDFDPEIWAAKPWNRYLIPGEGTVDVDGFLAGLPFDGTVTLEISAVREDGSVDAERLGKALGWLRTLAG